MPEHIPAWAALAFAALSGLGTWAFARRLLVRGAREELVSSLKDEFLTVTDGNGLGDRLKGVEVRMAEHDGRITSLERVDETHNFQVASLSERQGRLEGRQEKTESQLEDTLRKVESRLGNIEGQLSIIVNRKDRSL